MSEARREQSLGASDVASLQAEAARQRQEYIDSALREEGLADADRGELVLALRTTVNAMIEIFEQDNNRIWPSILGRVRQELVDNPVWGVQDFLSQFGGMGSLNDLVTMNPAFEPIHSRAYVIAKALRKLDQDW